jgi:hypothetical protein
MIITVTDVVTEVAAMTVTRIGVDLLTGIGNAGTSEEFRLLRHSTCVTKLLVQVNSAGPHTGVMMLSGDSSSTASS